MTVKDMFILPMLEFFWNKASMLKHDSNMKI